MRLVMENIGDKSRPKKGKKWQEQQQDDKREIADDKNHYVDDMNNTTDILLLHTNLWDRKKVKWSNKINSWKIYKGQDDGYYGIRTSLLAATLIRMRVVWITVGKAWD
jgi:hypothetical protein